MEEGLFSIENFGLMRHKFEQLRTLGLDVPVQFYIGHMEMALKEIERLNKQVEVLQSMQHISENMRDALQSYVGQPGSVERLREAAARLAKENTENVREQVIHNIWKRWQNRNTGELGRATFIANAASDINILLDCQSKPMNWEALRTELKRALELERYDTEEFTFPPCEMSDEQSTVCDDWLFSFMAGIEKNILAALEEFIDEHNKR